MYESQESKDINLVRDNVVGQNIRIKNANNLEYELVKEREKT